MKLTARARIEEEVWKFCGSNSNIERNYVFRDEVVALILAERARLKRGVRRVAKEKFARELQVEINDILSLWEK